MNWPIHKIALISRAKFQQKDKKITLYRTYNRTYNRVRFWKI